MSFSLPLEEDSQRKQLCTEHYSREHRRYLYLYHPLQEQTSHVSESKGKSFEPFLRLNLRVTEEKSLSLNIPETPLVNSTTLFESELILSSPDVAPFVAQLQRICLEPSHFPEKPKKL